MGAVIFCKMIKTLGLISAVLILTVSSEPLKDAFDGVEKYMTGHPIFQNQAFYDEFIACMNVLDARLVQSVGAQWDGMIEYSATKGNPPDDPWIQCTEKGKWFEVNCTVQEYGQMSIWEPCNYASNLAYYHTVTEICARQEWNLPLANVAYQAAMKNVLPLESSVIHLSPTPRAKSGIE